MPGFHNCFDEWVATQPSDRDPDIPDITDMDVKSIPARAGDLIIWNSLLPHGNSLNTSGRPRWSQYIRMEPARSADSSLRNERIEMWQDRLTPSDFPGDPRQMELLQGKPACLSELGRKLLGIDAW